MKDRVIIQRDQQVTAEDLNNMGLFPQEGIDLLIRNAIEPGLKYAGFVTLETGPAEVTVGEGLVFGDGKMYYRNDEGGVSISLLSNLPAVAQKYVAIVAYGVEQDNEVEPRTFLLDPVTRQTEARAVATVKSRVAQVDKVIGTESTAPLAPLVGANIITVALVLLDPTGIVSITQVTDNELFSGRDAADAIASIQIWQEQTGVKLETIQTDVTGLAEETKRSAPMETVLELARDVAQLKTIAELPATYSSYGYDPFLAMDQSDSDHNANTGTPTNPLFDAAVEEGIRFAPFAIAETQLTLLNVDETRVKTQDNFLLPTFTEVERIKSVGKDDELSLAQYENQTVEMVQKQVSRQRVRYGAWRRVCTNSAWWKSGKYNNLTGVFTKDGDTFETDLDINSLSASGARAGHIWVRIRQYWVDNYKEAYWDAIVTNTSVNGSVVAQTFLNSQETWMTGLGLYFTRKGNANINVAIVECTDGGAPDRTKMVAQTVLNAADIKIYPLQTKVVFQPTLLERGKRYAIVPISTGAHYLAVTQNNKFNQGTLFYSTDGSWFQGDLLKDIAFVLFAAKFASPRIEVQLQPLQLAGGILDIDILADAIVPSGCSLTYDVKIDNAWVPLAESDIGALNGLPPILQLRAVFQGTTDLMPRLGILSRSRARVQRSKTTYRHISTAYTPPAPVNTIWLDVRYEAYDAAHHTATAKIRSGAGYNTETTPTAVQVKPDPDGDPEVLIRRYIFSFGSAISSFKIDLAGTTDSVLIPYHVAFRNHVALNV